MTRSIALLRGVNVGGHRKLPMKELSAVLETIGCRNIRTYIQSGNVVYDGNVASDQIGAAIDDKFGFNPPVFIFTAKAFVRVAEQCPFQSQADGNPKSVHIYFLATPPEKGVEATLQAVKSADEMFALEKDALYLHSPKGLSASKIAEKADRILKVDNTARNWNTVCALIALAEDA